MVYGKTINGKCYGFNDYNLREKQFDELDQFHLIPQDIPNNIKKDYNIESWNETLPAFRNLDKLLESTSTTYQLAFHFYQLKYFENKKREEYSELIFTNYVEKTKRLFQENLQSALDLFGHYAELYNNKKIEFYDEEEEFEFTELFINSHCNFYPSDDYFKKENLNFIIKPKLLKKWLPRLEVLTNNISIIYLILADKIINEKLDDNKTSDLVNEN